MDSCCTCAQLVSQRPPSFNTQTEKIVPHKRLDCCGRLVCAQCIQQNPRFGTYCQFCQTAAPLAPAPEAPPAYSDTQSLHTPPPAPHPGHASLAHPPDEPPPYDGEGIVEDRKHPDVVHYLSPDDSMTSLSLSYKVPVQILRQHNNVWSDHLLVARKIFLIPGQYYQGPSLAPDPVEDAEETERKAKIRRLMTQCKIHEYDVALLYLEQAEWSFDLALQRYREDERWERDNPFKGKGRAADAKTIGRRLATRH